MHGRRTTLIARARRVRLLTCDVDGVLTDGRIYVDDHGHEFKAFCALDGVAMNLLARARHRRRVDHRQRSAGGHASRAAAAAFRTSCSMRDDKLTPWERLRGELGFAADACAHIGDDLPDIPLLDRMRLAVTVPHAPAAVRAHAHYVTRAKAAAAPCASWPS